MTRRLVRLALAGAGVTALLLGGLLIAAYLFFGNVGAHRERVESYLSGATGGLVRIGELSSSWTGIVPELRAVGVRLRDEQDRHTLLRVGEIRLRPKLLWLLRGELAFHRIVLDRPTVELVRQEDGRIALGEMEGRGEGSSLPWLLAQGQLTVSDGTLIWRDRRDPERTLTVRGIDLMLRENRGVRRIHGSARPPGTLTRSLRVEGNLSGTLEGGDLAGSLRLDTTGLVLAQLPLALTEPLPVSVAGTLDLQLAFVWRDGVLAGAQSQIHIVKPQVTARDDARTAHADSLSGALDLTRIPDGWRLRAWRPEWVKGADRFAPEEITVEKTGAGTSVSFKDVDLEGLSDVLLSLATPGERSGLAGQLRPRGRLIEGTTRLGEDWRVTGPLAVQVRFQDVSFDAQQKLPGITGLDGTLNYLRPEGKARIESERVTVQLPKSAPMQIVVDRIEGDIAWQRTENGWRVRGENLSARNPDAEFHSGNFELELPFDPAAAPRLRAATELARFEAPRVSAYVPELPKTEKFHKWYARALHAGRAVAGHIETEGSLDHFPYAQGGGRIEGWARVENAELDFEPGFPVVHAPSVEVGFKDSALTFRSTVSRLDNSPVKEVLVTLPAIFDKGQHLFVDGRAEVTLHDGLTFLAQGPLFKDEDVRQLFRMWKADGKGELKLKVDVPLKEPKESRVEGSYDFSAASALFMDQLEVRDVRAKAQFTDRSATAEAKGGEFLGGPVSLKLRTAEPGRPPKLVFDFSGAGAPARLANAFLPEMSQTSSGSAAWTGRIETAKGGWKATVVSNLKGVALDLPEPLRKAADIAVPLSFDYAARAGAADQLSLKLGDRASASLVLQRTESGGRRISGGEVLLGARQAASPGARGLQVRLRQPALDLDAWAAFAATIFPAGREKLPLPEIHVRARMERLRFLHRNWGAMAVSADSPDGRQWSLTLNGERISGAVRVEAARERAAFDLKLARLYVPALEGEEPPVAETPAEQPKLDVNVDDLRYADRALGRLELHARPADRSWQFEELTLSQPSLRLQASGAWLGEGEGESRFEIVAESADFGAALKALALEQRVEGGEGKITAQLRWPGAPGKFSKAAVEGSVEMDARRGRFAAMEAGAGRLFGLLNLDALTRRLRLDFSDVFGKGTPFDQFGGKAELGGGDLRTDGIVIVGPSLYIEASGRIGLVREDFDLDLIVAPPIAGNLSLIGALINPLYGAVMYLTQKVFKKQLARLVYYRYRVVGPWDHPEITRAKHEPEAATSE
jgi:uncharacterized protein (TIGR02099 family)